MSYVISSRRKPSRSVGKHSQSQAEIDAIL